MVLFFSTSHKSSLYSSSLIEVSSRAFEMLSWPVFSLLSARIRISSFRRSSNALTTHDGSSNTQKTCRYSGDLENNARKKTNSTCQHNSPTPLPRLINTWPVEALLATSTTILYFLRNFSRFFASDHRKASISPICCRWKVCCHSRPLSDEIVECVSVGYKDIVL